MKPASPPQVIDRVARAGARQQTPARANPPRVVLARTFAYLYGAGGLLALASLLLPHGQDASTAGIVAPALAALAAAGAILVLWARIPRLVFRCLPACGTVLASIVVVSGDTASKIPYASFYFFVVLSAFYLFDRRWAWINVAFVGGVLGLILARTRIENRELAWVTLMGVFSVGGAMIGLLRARLEQQVGDSEAALKRALASEHALAEAQRIARVGSWEANLDTREFRGSAQLFRMLELDAKQVATVDQVLAGLDPGEAGRLVAAFRAAGRTSGTVDIEHSVWLQGRRPRVLQTRGRVVRDPGGAVRLLGTTQDMTERRAQDERLQRTLRRLRATIDVALALGREPDPDGLLELISERARSLLPAQSVLVRLADAGQDGGDPIAGTGSDNRVLLAPLSYRGVTHGVLVAVAHPGGPGFSDDDDEMLRAFASSAATAVAGAKMVQREALRRRIEAGERERQRFARDLHDQTLQALGVLRMSLEAALAGGPDALAPAAERALRVIADEVENLRRIIADLRPAVLDDLGLAPALEALIERVRSDHGLDVVAEIELPGGHALPAPVEQTIYRVVQESLTNVCKHAEARQAIVVVRAEDDAVVVRVSDDGRGFDPGQSDGFGLVGMRERLESIDATLAVDSGAGGTTIEARLRLSGAALAPARPPLTA